MFVQLIRDIRMQRKCRSWRFRKLVTESQSGWYFCNNVFNLICCRTAVERHHVPS